MKIMFFLFLLTSFKVFADKPKANWNYLVFLNGRNSLERFSERTLRELSRVGSSDKVNVIVQLADFKSSQVRRLKIEKDPSGFEQKFQIVQILDSADMGRAETLIDFIKWSKMAFPSEQTALVIWDHGFGWHRIQDVSIDEETGNVISTEQLSESLSTYANTDGKLELIGFDACVMAMAEIASELKASAKFMVASSENEPAEGWPHSLILKDLENKLLAETINPQKLSEIIVESYQEQYQTDQSLTLAAVDLSKFEKFESETSKIIQSINDKMISKKDVEIKESIRQSLFKTRFFGFGDYRDFGIFLFELKKRKVISESEFIQMNGLFSNVFIKRFPMDLKISSGLSVWLPSSKDSYEEYKGRYKNLQWADETHWGDFLRTLFE